MEAATASQCHAAVHAPMRETDGQGCSAAESTKTDNSVPIVTSIRLVADASRYIGSHTRCLSVCAQRTSNPYNSSHTYITRNVALNSDTTSNLCHYKVLQTSQANNNFPSLTHHKLAAKSMSPTGCACLADMQEGSFQHRVSLSEMQSHSVLTYLLLLYFAGAHIMSMRAAIIRAHYTAFQHRPPIAEVPKQSTTGLQV